MTIDTRPAGRTAARLTTLGLGTATLGGNVRPPISNADAAAIVDRAYERGIRFFDTAPYYGYGRSERLVGDTLRGRSGWVLSTKAGRLLRPRTTPQDAGDQWIDPLPFEHVYDYSYDGVMRSFEDSLQRLGLDHIDLLLLHDIGSDTHGTEKNAELFPVAMQGGYKALDALRASGAVKAIGIGVNEWQVLVEAMKHGDWDAFLLAGRYTLLEQEPLTTLLPLCERAGTSIIVGGPFNSGILAGRDTWNYSRAPQPIIDRVRRIAAVCDAHGVALPAAALAFPLGHPSVASVIPGPRSAAEVDQIVDWFEAEIPASLWSDLKTEGLIDPAAPVPA
ncbi:aldo/keto reductase [Kaistia geumhonensis]|uniref:D-threo-aldose 1-dehydrogenase n=1 Tax=Kaistia geumhonensis TaxID=410839 RepID=A0ABU0MAZ9_9HYPH|nr:aldo/keto reductase [Kaistia geumhonensis]MCX5481093.1 aldo/keto reductase [Kaistia geumhonensis]MDQ0518153.1 D-threo-aldose 1-dehydrogenase [Kaistia geumhonensis]